jgi:predicted Na+-dependent transporter
MPSPEQVRQWADAGGLVLFLALLILIGIGLWRGWWVPGPFYREKADAVKTLTATVERLTKALERERRRRSTDVRD